MLKSRESDISHGPILFMTEKTAKPLINPAIQAKLLLARIALTGLARDFWKDAPMPWPRWAKNIIAKFKQSKADKAAKAAQAKAAALAAAAAKKAKTTDTVDVKPVTEPQVWTADRVQIMEKMWGEGMHLPGGDAYLTALSSPIGLNHELSVLDLGAGLGGLARRIVDTYKCYVTGMEQDAILAARGMIMSIAAGKSKTASVVGYDTATFSASRKYDAIFAREVFYRVIGKEKFFKAVDASLKTGGGHLVFTDYILDPAVREKPAIVQWLARERGAAPLSMIEMIKTWKGMGYDLRIAEDQTDFYKANILIGLKNLVEHMVMNIPDNATKAFVLAEVDLWAKRLAAFHEGLRYCRFYGIKY